jgi:hypothetical protein
MTTTFTIAEGERIVTLLDNGTIGLGLHDSFIAHMTYHADYSDLWVTFTNGSQYEYKSVPVAVFHGLMVADSIGSFYNKNIRNAYECEKLK